MSTTSFKVIEPTEFTIQIGVTVHNGTVTVQPHVQQLLNQQQQQSQPQPQQQNASPNPEQQSLKELLRGFNNLSVNSEPARESAAMHQQLRADVSELEPPSQLSQTKRRERAAQRVRPAAIPDVPDTEADGDADCGQQQPLRARRSRRSPGAAAAVQPTSSPAWRCSSGRPELLIKAPDRAVTTGAGGTSKLMRPQEKTAEQASELELAQLDDIHRGAGGEVAEPRRRRQPSAAVAPPDSPYAPSGASSHASSSPPASYRSAPTPPAPRRRGRPPKVRANGSGCTAQAMRPASAVQPLQPRPSLATATSIRSGAGIDDFVSASELAEATKMMARYTDEELRTPNEQGDLMSHRLAREANWPKLVAVNKRWLSNSSLGDIFTSINTPNQFGHSVILEAVVQQNVKAVEYCCLFTSSSDGNLFRALSESALRPSDAVFFAVLRTMCHEMDENGNAVKRLNPSIDRAIGGWRFINPELAKLAGLTLTQALTLAPASTHRRLAALIDCGASPTHPISIDAPEFYRCYLDSVHLAAAFSPAPFECLVVLGMSPEAERPLRWDSTGEIIDYCVKTICGRSDLNPSYQESVRQKFSRSAPLPQLDADEIRRFFGEDY